MHASIDLNQPKMSGENKENQEGGTSYQQPWIEKYRPQALEDVVGNEDTLVRLQAIAKDGNLPNLILCGPPGTGKASLCLIDILTLVLVNKPMWMDEWMNESH